MSYSLPFDMYLFPSRIKVSDTFYHALQEPFNLPSKLPITHLHERVGMRSHSPLSAATTAAIFGEKNKYLVGGFGRRFHTSTFNPLIRIRLRWRLPASVL
eukprot:1387944-Amorphochlora_amoeboformis.AAC.2